MPQHLPTPSAYHAAARTNSSNISCRSTYQLIQHIVPQHFSKSSNISCRSTSATHPTYRAAALQQLSRATSGYDTLLIDVVL